MNFSSQAGSVLDAAAAAEVIGRGQAVVLDVREDDEWASGHIPGATHIPMGQVSLPPGPGAR